MLDRSRSSGLMRGSAISQTPEKTHFRLKQLEREVQRYRQEIQSKDEQIQYLGNKNKELLQSRTPSDKLFENSLQGQIDRLTLKLAEKGRDYEKLYAKYVSVENEMAALEDEVSEVVREKKFLADKLAEIEIHADGDEMEGELENKMVLMSTEITRLSQLSRLKAQEANELKFKIGELQDEKDLLDRDISEKDRLIMQYRDRMRGLQKRLEELEMTKSYENESSYKMLSQEVEKLNSQLYSRLEEISTLEHKVKVLEGDKNSIRNSRFSERNAMDLELENERIAKSNAVYKKQMAEMEEMVKQMKRENGELREENERMRRSNKKLELELEEQRKVTVKEQNEKIRIEVETHQRTIHEQRTIIEQLRNREQMRDSSLRQKFEEDIYYMKTMLSQSEEKSSSLHKSILKYEEKLVLLSQELERLTAQNSNYMEENAELKRLKFKIESKERELKEIDRMRELYESESRREKLEIDRLKQENTDLWEKNHKLEGEHYQLRSLKDELDIVSERYREKASDCKRLQEKLSEQVAWQDNKKKVSELEAQLFQQRNSWKARLDETSNRLEQEIRTNRTTITQLQDKLRQVMSENSSSEDNYLILAEEIQRLNKVLSEASETILNQKRSMKLLESNLQAAEASLQKVRVNTVPSEQVERQIKKQVEVYQSQIRLLQAEISQSKSKVQELFYQNTHKEHENGQLRMAYQEAKTTLRNKQQEVKDLLASMKMAKKSEDSLLDIIKDIKASNARLEQKLADIERDYILRLDDKSRQRQKSEKQLIQLQGRLRQTEAQLSEFKYESMVARNKLELMEARQRQLEDSIDHRDEKLRDAEREKGASIKRSQEDLFEKLSNYEIEARRYVREIGELEGNLRGQTENVRRLEQRVRQLEQEKENLNLLSSQRNERSRRENDAKLQQITHVIGMKEQEVASLRRKFEEIEAENRSQKASVESQTRSLRAKYEEQVAMLSQEIERLNGLTYDKNNEIQQLKDELKAHSAEGNKQNKETINTLGLEISRLNTVLCENMERLKEVEDQLQIKQRELSRVASLNRKNEEHFKESMKSLEEEVDKITKENHKLSANSAVLERKVEDLQKLEPENNRLKSNLSELNSEKNRLAKMITELESQNSRLNIRFEENLHDQHHSLQSKASSQISSLEEARTQMERKMALLAGENEQLVRQIQNLKEELQKSDDENNWMNRQIVRLKSENVNLNREKEKFRLVNEEVMGKLHHFSTASISSSEKQQLEQKIRHLEAINRQYENRIALMAQEIQRLNVPKGQPGGSGTGGELRQKYDILESIHVKLKREHDGLREKLTEYEFKMKKLRAEFDLINKLTHEYKDENEYLRQHNHSQCIFIGTLQNEAISQPSDLSAEDRRRSYTEDMLIKQTLNSEIDRLGVLNNSLRREVEDLRVQGTEVNLLRNRHEEMLGLFVILAAEVDSLRGNR